MKKMDDLFSVGYTAKMEAELDQVEEKGVAMDDMLSGFYARLLKEISDASEPPPDRAKFDAVFALLAQVKEWKPAKKVGKRVYDDRAFVESVKAQAEEGTRPLSMRQLQSLVRVAAWYHDQIPDCEARLAAASLAPQKIMQSFADQDLVKYCFEKMDCIPELKSNRFLISVREQAIHGRGLTQRQLWVVARAILEKVSGRPDEAEIRARLSDFADAAVSSPADGIAGELLQMLKSVKVFRAPTRFGKRVYDDKSFYKSLTEQYARRQVLSDRQVSALKRIVRAYREQIPDYEAKKDALGLESTGKEDKGGGDGAE